MAEEEADAVYSDGEFGSEHDNSEDYGEFEDDKETVQDSSQQEPKEELTEEDVAAEAEDYDGDFDEDEAIQTDETDGVTNKQALNAVTRMTQASDLPMEVSSSTDLLVIDRGQNTAISDTPVEYVQEEALELSAVALNAEETAMKRRASLPGGMSECSPPRKPFLHSGSMPMILSAKPIDKWMDTIPQELSPGKTDRPKLQIARLPVLQEPSSVDGEINADDAEDCDNDSIGDTFTPDQVNPHIRAQSYRDLQREKEVVPIRRSQSLLYTGSLPSVEETRATEEATDRFPDQDDDNYGNDSDTVQTPDNESFSRNEPSSGLHESNGNMRQSADDDHIVINALPDAKANVKLSPDASSVESVGEPVHRDKELNAEPQDEEEDEYTDEMEDDFPSDFDASQFEGGDTPHKPRDDVSGFDVEEIIDEGRRETQTDTLLEEARSLLQQEQNDSRDRASYSDQDISPVDDTPRQVGDCNDEASDAGAGTNANAVSENVAFLYDDDNEFAEDDDAFCGEEIADDNAANDVDYAGQYDFDEDKGETYEAAALPQDESQVPTAAVQPTFSDTDASKMIAGESPNVERATIVPIQVGVQPADGKFPAEQDAVETKSEDPIATLSENSTVSDPLSATVETQAAPVNLLEPSQLIESPTVYTAADQEKKRPGSHEHPPKPTRPGKTQVTSRPTRHRPVKPAIPPAQSPPPSKPSRPFTNRTVPSSPSTGTRRSTPANHSTAYASSTENSPGEVVKTSSPPKSPILRSVPRKLDSPSKTGQKASSPRPSSKTSLDPYEHLLNEYPRKEPVPKQKAISKHFTNGEHRTKRQPLQPVKTPAKLRFDLPRMEKSKRDWLFANMFRHGDDMSKYEAFVAPALFAKPPTSSSSKTTKKRPLSARQLYGDPQTSVLATRKPVQQPWVATSLRDSKLPQYDSILDKFCTTVTSPMVQRQIYQTRHRDLSPQLAFVLEKRVEQQCKKGFYDSFGGVSSSYNTEVVPTSLSNGNMLTGRQVSPRGQTNSGMLPEQ